MKIGYARVSTNGQSYEAQKELLENAGCEEIFVEKVTGTSTEKRKALKDAKKFARKGDSLVVTKLDRLARSVPDLHNIANELKEKEVNLIFLKEQIDTNIPTGKLMFSLLGAIAEFEADLIRERTSEGRKRAMEQGKHMGRPGPDDKAYTRAFKMYEQRNENKMSVQDICKLNGIKRSTFYKKLKDHKYLTNI